MFTRHSVPGFHGAAQYVKAAFCGPTHDFRGGVLSDDRQLGVGFQQQAQLCECSVPTARKNDTTALNGQEDGEVLHVRNPD